MTLDLDRAAPELDSVMPDDGIPPAIRVRDLWYAFGNRDVLRGISFNVEAGEIFGFVGPRGSGKTTAIRILATLLEPKRGEVEIQGLSTTLEPQAVRTTMGYVPAQSDFYEQLSIREYLDFFERARRPRLASRISYVMELTRLAEIQHQLTATLGIGVRQRLGVARALLHDPSVLILDEPMRDADPQAQDELRALLLDLSSLNKTIFLSSKALSELGELCRRIGILDQGRLLTVGSIGEIAARLDPQSLVGWPQKGASDLQQVRVRVRGDSANVVALLSALPDVVEVQVEPPERLSIRYKNSDQFVAELIRYLVAHEVSLLSVEPAQDELGRIFRELTERES